MTFASMDNISPIPLKENPKQDSLSHDKDNRKSRSFANLVGLVNLELTNEY